jgi:hypothetical protein
MTPDQYAAHARSLKDIDLEIIVSTKVPSSQEAIAAKYELARRERRRTFWLRDIVAWVALVLAVISIILSLYGSKP